MRIFSNLEKQIIDALYTPKNNGAFLLNFVFEQLENENLEVNSEERIVKVIIPIIEISERVNQHVIDRIEEIQEMVVVTANLLSYLERNGLILIVKTTENAGSIDYVQKTILPKKVITREFPDREINDLFLRFLNKKILATPELNDLRNHGYQSKGDRRYRIQMIAIWIGIGIALVTSLLSIWISTRSLSDTSVTDTIRQLRDEVQKSSDSIQETIYKMPINEEAIHLHQMWELLSAPSKQ